MNARERPDGDRDARFAASIGVTPADIETVEYAFSTMTSKIGIDGKKTFDALRRGESFGAALSVPPKSVPLLYARAHSWFAIGRTDKACLLFRALCAIAGSVPDHWVGWGICLKKSQRLAEAEQAFLTGAARRPEWAVPYFHLMETYMRLGDRQRALQACEAYEARIVDDTPETLQAEACRHKAMLLMLMEARDADRTDENDFRR